MKDIKNTLKSIAATSENQKSLWRRLAKKLWRSFLLFPVAAAIAVCGLFSVCCNMMVPAAELHSQTGSWRAAFILVDVDYLGILLLAAGTIAAAWASWMAHRAMLGAVTGFPKAEMSKNRRHLLYVEVVSLVLLVLWVGGLPIVALLLSGIAAGGSGLGSAPVATPLWVVFALVGLSLLFVLALEVVLTFVRLCFRELLLTPDPATDVVGMADSEFFDVEAGADGASSDGASSVAPAVATSSETEAAVPDFEPKTKK